MVKISEAQYKSQIASLNDELRESVKAFCLAHPDSLRSLARQAGFSVAYLSDIIRGRRNVSDAVVKKLAKLK